MTHETGTPDVAASRGQLLARHRAARRLRNQAPLGSPEFQAACEEIARIEVEIARLERAANPPLV